MKRKLLAAILSVAMAATLLTGCGGASETSGGAGDSTASADSEASADGVQEISWMFWDDLNATEDLITKGYGEVIDRFNKDYEGVYHVTPITTNLEEYYPKLNALV
ncbi:MAG: ABC transporter substrate-binding protein, partial [Lachnospiraceae bacterium]